MFSAPSSWTRPTWSRQPLSWSHRPISAGPSPSNSPRTRRRRSRERRGSCSFSRSPERDRSHRRRPHRLRANRVVADNRHRVCSDRQVHGAGGEDVGGEPDRLRLSAGGPPSECRSPPESTLTMASGSREESLGVDPRGKTVRFRPIRREAEWIARSPCGAASRRAQRLRETYPRSRSIPTSTARRSESSSASIKSSANVRVLGFP
jgi:hypothetical protein